MEGGTEKLLQYLLHKVNTSTLSTFSHEIKNVIFFFDASGLIYSYFSMAVNGKHHSFRLQDVVILCQPVVVPQSAVDLIVQGQKHIHEKQE